MRRRAVRGADPHPCSSIPTVTPYALARLNLFALVATVLLADAAPAYAQTEIAETSDSSSAETLPALQALPVAGEAGLDLDGRLDEAVWQQATPISDFTQQDPREGAEPSERTEIRVIYDENALYIGAKLFDDPEGILAFQKRRDQGLGTDDRFMWIFDTFRDGRTGYFFEINANGLMGDGLIGGRVNKTWDGIWEAQVERLPDGWSAEIRIPFQTLNFNPESDRWGINFQRTIRRRNEEILWRGWRRNQGLFNPVFAGRMTGLQGLSQGIGIEVKPYATQRYLKDTREFDPTTFPRDVGFDLGYNLTPSLRAALSWNTDFAEAEVDQRQVNLTRFALRFPEQRDFFLEGSGVFSFASRSGPSPYFSRRIGLEGGVPVPIGYAARLGGQAGRYELGFIHANTESEAAADATDPRLPSEDFTVARVKRTLFSQSSIGALYTRRATRAGDVAGPAPLDRHTVGVDADFQTASFMGDQNLSLSVFAVWNSNPQRDTERSLDELTARGFRLNFPNEYWQAHLSYREFGTHYDPAVGFVPRNGFKRIEPRVAWRPRIESVDWIRRFQFDLQYRELDDITTGQLLERTWDFGLFSMDFESQDQFSVGLSRQYEFLDRDFNVGGQVPVTAGPYTTWRWNARLQTARYRRISLEMNADWGEFWDGDRMGLSSQLTLQPLPGYRIGLELERNQIDLAQGSLDTNLVRINGGWDISPWASFTGNVQYDDLSELLGAFGLLRWIVKPGNEVFLVYSHNWLRTEPFGPDAGLGDGSGEGAGQGTGQGGSGLGLGPRDRSFATLSRGATIKVNYTWRW